MGIRISAVPPFPGLRRFPDGRDYNQWTGDDSKALMKVSSHSYNICKIVSLSPFIRSILAQSQVICHQVLWNACLPLWKPASWPDATPSPFPSLSAFRLVLPAFMSFETYSLTLVFGHPFLYHVNTLLSIITCWSYSSDLQMASAPQSQSQSTSKLSRSHGVNWAAIKHFSKCSDQSCGWRKWLLYMGF